MKNISIALFTLCVCMLIPCKAVSNNLHSEGQNPAPVYSISPNTVSEAVDFIEQLPEFPGGTEALLKYISERLKYPESSAKKGIQGKCMVRFMVTKKGNVKKVKVITHLDDDCDREAIRVIKSLPKFIPGRNAGKPKDVWLNIPVIFVLK